MPYRYANYFAGFVLLTIIVGFWGSYFTPSFGLSMVFAIVAYLVLFYLALRNRRSVRLHACDAAGVVRISVQPNHAR